MRETTLSKVTLSGGVDAIQFDSFPDKPSVVYKDGSNLKAIDLRDAMVALRSHAYFEAQASQTIDTNWTLLKSDGLGSSSNSDDEDFKAFYDTSTGILKPDSDYKVTLAPSIEYTTTLLSGCELEIIYDISPSKDGSFSFYKEVIDIPAISLVSATDTIALPHRILFVGSTFAQNGLGLLARVSSDSITTKLNLAMFG